MCGAFSPKAKPIFHDGIPEHSEFLSLPEDWDHFRKLNAFLCSEGNSLFSSTGSLFDRMC